MGDQPIPIIDLFAGPGGMGEGFSAARDDKGNPIFRVIMSVEMERTAHATLQFRAFARKIMDADGSLPQDYLQFLRTPSEGSLDSLQEKFSDEWAASEAEAVQGTLADGDDTFVNMAVERLKGWHVCTMPIEGCAHRHKRTPDTYNGCRCKVASIAGAGAALKRFVEGDTHERDDHSH